MKKFFITGGSGFIGTNLIDFYLKKDFEVLNYDIKQPRNNKHVDYWVEGDILDIEKLKASITEFQPDYIVHLAARTDLDGSTLDDYPANTQGVENLIDALQVAPSLKRVLFASLRLVCKIGYQPVNEQDYCPTTAYGESKVIGEKIVKDRAEDIPCAWLIFRPTSIWGPWFDVPYKDFFMMIMNGRYVHPLGKSIRKSFGFVGNSVYMIDKFVGCEERLIHKKTLYLTDYPELEAQASGCPVFASNRAPMTEVGGEAAVYIDPLFPEAGAKVINEHLSDLQVLRDRGLENAEKFSNAAMRDGYLNIYRQVSHH